MKTIALVTKSKSLLLVSLAGLAMMPPPQPSAPKAVVLVWNASASDVIPGDPLNYGVGWGSVSGGPYPNSTNVGTNLTVTLSGLAGQNYFVVYAVDTNQTPNAISPWSNQTNWTQPNIPSSTTFKSVIGQ